VRQGKKVAKRFNESIGTAVGRHRASSGRGGGERMELEKSSCHLVDSVGILEKKSLTWRGKNVLQIAMAHPKF